MPGDPALGVPFLLGASLQSCSEGSHSQVQIFQNVLISSDLGDKQECLPALPETFTLTYLHGKFHQGFLNTKLNSSAQQPVCGLASGQIGRGRTEHQGHQGQKA